MLPNEMYDDNEAPESGLNVCPQDTIENKRDYLRSLIMELTDEECELLLVEWRMRHV